MSHRDAMYRWRRASEKDRQAILADRAARNHPLHSPFHLSNRDARTDWFLVTAACYEHRRIIGQSTERLSDFAQQLCQVLTENSSSVTAWVVLANHYHALVECPTIARMLAALGKLHGRSSYQWNLKDRQRGRRVWCKAAETAMKSEGHFFATVNYIFHNPVRHGYCRRWTDWPHSNVDEYLAAVGTERARRVWNAYPLHEYGDGWDPPEL